MPGQVIYKHGWRKCSEEMPERFVDVLVVDGDGWHFISHVYDETVRFRLVSPDMGEITHWQPLPPAPTEAE